MIIATTTFSTDRDAKLVAKTAIEEGLAACAEVTPVNTIYKWEGVMKDEIEYKLVLKTTKEKLASLEKRVKEMHKYSLPQWTWFEADASKEYSDWVSR
ncbi:divalent-cation tolerance protein CutA [archaeon]